MTYRFALYDIQSLLKQTYVNKEFADNQVLFWILMYANMLRKRHDEKTESGTYLHVYKKVNVYKELDTKRKYIILPADIFDLDKDGAIVYITYNYSVDICDVPTFTSITFERTSPQQSKVLYLTEEETPRSDNPKFYRENNNIFFLGLECIDIKYVEIGLKTTMNPSIICDLDTTMELPDEMYPILKEYILNMGKFGLMIPEESVNKGTNDVSPDKMPISKQFGNTQIQPEQEQQQQTQ